VALPTLILCEVSVPHRYVGDIIAELNRLGAAIQELQGREGRNQSWDSVR